MTLTFGMMLFLLVVGHALADFPLQGDFLAQAKNRHTQLGQLYWTHALPAHALIHGGFVAVITGQVWLGVAEAVIHGVTDWLKCEKKISLNTDQAIHLLCKLAWATLAFYVMK